MSKKQASLLSFFGVKKSNSGKVDTSEPKNKRRKIVDDEPEKTLNQTDATTTKETHPSTSKTANSVEETIKNKPVTVPSEAQQEGKTLVTNKKEESIDQSQNKAEISSAQDNSKMEVESTMKISANVPIKDEIPTIQKENISNADQGSQEHEKMKTKASSTKESSSFSSSSDSGSCSSDEESIEESDHEDEREKAKKTEVTRNVPKRKPISKAKVKSHSIDVNYDVEKNGWEKGKDGPYMLLAKAFATVESESGRIIKTIHLANAYRTIIAFSPQDLIYAIYLSIGSLAPEYEGLELGIGESALMTTISDVTGVSVKTLKSKLRIEGDLGQVAMQFKKSARPIFKPAPLTLKLVFTTLREIAQTDGTKSRKKKTDLIKKLMIASNDVETLYLIRTLENCFRIGCNKKTVLAALARAIVQTPPKPLSSERSKKEYDMLKALGQERFDERVEFAHEQISKAYSELPNLNKIVEELLKSENAIDTLCETCKITPGIPLHPMLAQPTKGISEVLTRIGNRPFTCEFKYDGERAQIHYYSQPDGSHVIKIFSRNLEDNTSKYPDLVKQLPNAIHDGVDSFIIDCEAVAWDAQENKLLPFQVLIHRSRKNVDIKDVKIQVCLHCFDILYRNGNILIEKTFKERRQILYQTFKEIIGEFHFASYINIEDDGDIYPFLQKAVNEQCEGLMVKTLDVDSQYEPSRRSYNWLKIKKDYMDGMTDSVDLTIIGAWRAKGKQVPNSKAITAKEGNSTEKDENHTTASDTKPTEKESVDASKPIDVTQHNENEEEKTEKAHETNGCTKDVDGADGADGADDEIYDSFLLACFDDNAASFPSIAKMNISSARIPEAMKHLRSCRCAVLPPNCQTEPDLKSPDVFFIPRVVVEVKGLDLAFSPYFSAAKGKFSETPQGFELRKAAFLRYREDKSPESGTSVTQLVELYHNQTLFGAKTVYLVPIGAYYGVGKRVNTYGGFLLASYSPESETFQAMVKVGTGLTDEVLAAHYTFFSQHTIKERPFYYELGNAPEPDVWLQNVQVWEVKGADFTLSPNYPSAFGSVASGKGVSLRFPRFIRISTDKTPEDATTDSELASLYRAQALCVTEKKGSEMY